MTKSTFHIFYYKHVNQSVTFQENQGSPENFMQGGAQASCDQSCLWLPHADTDPPQGPLPGPGPCLQQPDRVH